MKKRTPELLAPGGSFHSALAAFDAGADGVYLGMKEFSARKAASNFSLEQLRRIRGLAAERGRRIAVTVNTVVRDTEMGRLADTLGWLEALGVDAVIVQDLGVREVAARFFPRLALHASTQMAVHNSAGLSEAKALGFRRVVLARELPLESIRRLRGAHPDIELEVFAHGALCYSFSGICLASWALTGRSANRGDCAQICRSLFQGGDVGGHLFSCRDLSLGSAVRALAEAGVDALKIEGRMKSPEYVFHTVRLYREILDRGDELSEEEERQLERRSRLGFARETTAGYLRSPSGTSLVDTRYPDHKGAVLGTVQSVRGGEMSLALAGDLSLRDGVGFFPRGGRAGASSAEPLLFSVQGIRKAGREVRFARAGETVSIELPREPGAPRPSPGDEVRHLSSRFLDLPQQKEARFALYRIPVTLHIVLTREDGRGVLGVSVRSGQLMTPEFSAEVTVERAEGKKPFAEILAAVFAESGEGLFRAEGISFENRTSLPDDGIFVPPSQLKKAKNDFYRRAEEFHASTLAARSREAAEAGPALPAVQADSLTPAETAAFPHRETLSPTGTGMLPFVSRGPGGIRAGSLSKIGRFTCVPLPPVMLDEMPWFEAVRFLLDSEPGTSFAIGLSNVSHLALADSLALHSNAWFFIDFFLYVANRFALEFLCRRVPRLLFAYAWIEDSDEGFAHTVRGQVPVLRIAEGFHPPLFYSLGCLAKHALLAGNCPDEAARSSSPDAPPTGGCSRDYVRDLTQGRHRFRLVVKDCVTYLFDLS